MRNKVNPCKKDRIFKILDDQLKTYRASELKWRAKEERFNTEKERYNEKQRQTVWKIAKECSTQVERKLMIRELYWNTEISIELIGEAFNVPAGKVRHEAGQFDLSITCINCGRDLHFIYNSRSERDRDLERRGYALCDECKEKDQRGCVPYTPKAYTGLANDGGSA